jgi:6-phosphofructo-2-kinase / fructose-2,6-biphosphatase 3
MSLLTLFLEKEGRTRRVRLDKSSIPDLNAVYELFNRTFPEASSSSSSSSSLSAGNNNNSDTSSSSSILSNVNINGGLTIEVLDKETKQLYELEEVGELEDKNRLILRRLYRSEDEEDKLSTTRLRGRRPLMHASFERKKLVIVMVGTPGVGKTYIARKICRYLCWLDVPTRVFNVGEFRRSRVGAQMPHTFYDPANEEGRKARLHCAVAVLDEMVDWMHSDGWVGLFDATNTTKSRRDMILARLRPEGFHVMFIESICESAAVVEANVREVKTSSPDYVGVAEVDAVSDFMARIEQYKKAYETIDDESLCFIKLYDVGRKVVANRVNSYLAGRILFFLMNLHTEPRRIWLTRHGQSTFNQECRVGGDPNLTPAGELYAHRLAEWVRERSPDHTAKPLELLVVWTSTLRRSIQTGKYIPAAKVHLRSLDEIDAGIYDGLSYDEIRERYPHEYHMRSRNKLTYRYPRGESYLDLAARLEPVIFELERRRAPLLVIGHQAVLRCLYAYFMERPLEEVPHLPIPLHTLIEITPKAYGCVERLYPLVSHEEVQEANTREPIFRPISPMKQHYDTAQLVQQHQQEQQEKRRLKKKQREQQEKLAAQQDPFAPTQVGGGRHAREKQDEQQAKEQEKKVEQSSQQPKDTSL